VVTEVIVEPSVIVMVNVEVVAGMVTVREIVWMEPETAVKVVVTDVAAGTTRVLVVVTVLWETTEVLVDVTTPGI
jgi:hypothetical protein